MNDRLGHWSGDLLLQQVAERLKSVTREEHPSAAIATAKQRPLVGRIGGDQFAIAIPGVGERVASAYALELLESFDEPFELSTRNTRLRIRPSIGLACAPEHGTTPGELLRSADLAMVDAKRARERLPRTYRGEVDLAHKRYRRLQADLEGALARRELEVHFQPRVRMRDQRIVSAEALVRWNHPDLGWIPPAEFVPIAEESDTIQELGAWVLDEVCSRAASRRVAGLPEIQLSVNVSPLQLEADGLAERFVETIRRHEVDPQQLEFEITESLALQDLQQAERSLEALHAAGCQIALDDFGTGYSSMQILLQLPLDTLKLDRSLIMKIDSDEDSASVLRAMIAMAHSIGLHVVAEGIDSTAQFNILRRLGCDQGQGYLFAKPVRWEELSERLEGQNDE